MPFLIKVYTVEIFTRATPGSSLVFSYIRWLSYKLDASFIFIEKFQALDLISWKPTVDRGVSGSYLHPQYFLCMAFQHNNVQMLFGFLDMYSPHINPFPVTIESAVAMPHHSYLFVHCWYDIHSHVKYVR